MELNIYITFHDYIDVNNDTMSKMIADLGNPSVDWRNMVYV